MIAAAARLVPGATEFRSRKKAPLGRQGATERAASTAELAVTALTTIWAPSTASPADAAAARPITRVAAYCGLPWVAANAMSKGVIRGFPDAGRLRASICPTWPKSDQRNRV